MFLVLPVNSRQPGIYKGNVTDWHGVLVSSSPTVLISSWTYTGKSDWLIVNDKNGYDVWVDSCSEVDTLGLESFKIYPDGDISPNGRLRDSVWAKTLDGSSNLTTCWILITAEE